MSERYDFLTVDFNKGNFSHGANSLRRVAEVFGNLRDAARCVKNADAVYLTLSQSIAGNLKDLAFLFLTRGRPQIVHLHGSGIGRLVFSKPLLKMLNRRAYRRVKKIIVLSDSLASNFEGIALRRKIISVANGVPRDLFIGTSGMAEKHENSDVVNFLFMSNLIRGKGYEELRNAGFMLNSKGLAQKYSLTFVGNFGDEQHERDFVASISDTANMEYRGFAWGEDKRRLLMQSHVFALPSSYPYEGQPISILEAYAAGCAVITSRQGGIPDIFSDGVNGFEVEPRSVESIAEAMERTISEPELRRKISLTNRATADQHFTLERYIDGMNQAFAEVVGQ